MRQKRVIIKFMLFISIIMLIAPVMPHHHQAEGLICVTHSTTQTDSTDYQNSHSQSNNGKECNSHCLTQIRLNTPETINIDAAPQHLLIAILFDNDILYALLHPQERELKRKHYYIESLHGIQLASAFSLRGPPSFLVA